jgi:hypothetical protein
MVELRLYVLLNEFEINNHPVGIQLLGFAIYGNSPIMSVQVTALAGIREFQMMAGRYYQPLAYIIHKFIYDLTIYNLQFIL